MNIQSEGRGRDGLRILMMLFCLLSLAAMIPRVSSSQGKQTVQAHPQLVWVDTDIGDDIDDVFALGLIVRSPELRVLGVSTAFGDTETRARLTDRFLSAIGVSNIPVTAGVHTETNNLMTQKAYALQSPARTHADGVQAMLEAIQKYPGEVTLIAIGPLFNVGAAIERDPKTFHQLRRVVMMGGSVYRGYGAATAAPMPEWNILQDPKGAAKLFASGVPIYMMPLDSTQVPLEEVARKALFARGTPLTEQLKQLYGEWSATAPNHPQTPTLFDPVAAAYTFRPDLCPTKPMRIEVDAKGMTKPMEGKPNAEVCQKSDEKDFLGLLTGRLEGPSK